MATPISSLTPYCSAESFLQRYDFRTIIQLMADVQGGRQSASPASSRQILLDNTTYEGGNLYLILQTASGEVEAAVGAAGMYSPTALTELTGNSAAFLAGLVADLALYRCYLRRPDMMAQMPEAAQQARGTLAAIAHGTNVLGLAENIEAGVMELTFDTPLDVENRFLTPVICRRMFGTRGDQLRWPWGNG